MRLAPDLLELEDDKSAECICVAFCLPRIGEAVQMERICFAAIESSDYWQEDAEWMEMLGELMSLKNLPTTQKSDLLEVIRSGSNDMGNDVAKKVCRRQTQGPATPQQAAPAHL